MVYRGQRALARTDRTGPDFGALKAFPIWCLPVPLGSETWRANEQKRRA
jgi:hypothetical protein